MNYTGDAISFYDYTEEDEENHKPKPWLTPVSIVPKSYDYDFNTDEVIEINRVEYPTRISGEENMMTSILNIMSYMCGRIINNYMEKLCKNNHSYISKEKRPCKINMKNEFYFRRVLMTLNKKNYASYVFVQEGNLIPEDKRLAVSGIECMTKSTKAESTRNALKKIVMEDIMKTPVIDQVKFIKDMAILEKQIIKSLRDGSKEYYKPATIKSASAYDDPLRIQGIKASMAWNMIKPSSLPAIDLTTRNAVSIAKVIINKANAENIKDLYPEVYENIINALDDETFITRNKQTGKVTANKIDAVAIPLDERVPDWLMEFIDYDTIVCDNIASFPTESLGIMKGNNKNVNYSNIVQL
jgi:hypothetical protein